MINKKNGDLIFLTNICVYKRRQKEKIFASFIPNSISNMLSMLNTLLFLFLSIVLTKAGKIFVFSFK